MAIKEAICGWKKLKNTTDCGKQLLFHKETIGHLFFSIKKLLVYNSKNA